MTIDDAVKVLELFNSKVDKLDNYRFTKFITTRRTGIKISSTRKDDGLFETNIDRDGPDAESVDALLPTFRQFFLNKDQISIGRLAPIYSPGIVGEKLATQFLQIRNELNKYLDEPHEVRFEEKGYVLTRREMMDMHLYGDLAHTYERPRERLIRWTNSEVSFEMSFNELTVIMSQVLRALWWFRNLNQSAIAHITRSTSDGGRENC